MTSEIGAIVILTTLIGGLLGKWLAYRREQAELRSEVRPRRTEL